MRITLSSSRAGLKLQIIDDGHGIQTDGNKKREIGVGGLGLRNMQERMAHFGGKLDVTTSGAGTQLAATLPKSIFLSQTKERAII